MTLASGVSVGAMTYVVALLGFALVHGNTLGCSISFNFFSLFIIPALLSRRHKLFSKTHAAAHESHESTADE